MNLLPPARARAPRLPLATAAAALALVALVGCGGQDDTKDGSSAAGHGAASGSTSDGSAPGAQPLPLDAIQQTSAEDEKTIQQAANLLMTSCMKRYGFDYTPPPETGEQQRPRVSAYARVPEEQARQYGYRSPGGAPEEGQEAGDGKAGSAAEQAVRVGGGAASVGGKAVPKGGCKGEVAATMDAGLPRLPEPSPVEEASDAALQKAQSDTRLTAAVHKWSSCMKGRGYVFARPEDPEARFVSGKGTTGGKRATSPAEGQRVAGTATDEEKKVAIADGECNAEAALEKTWYEVLRPLEQAEIDRRAADFKIVADWSKGYVKNAQKALAGNG